VRLGIAEVSHDAVAEILGDLSFEARYRFRGAAMISGNHLAPFFGIESGSDLGRADEIAEEHGQMAPFTARDLD
jgi:hypothetical protein